MSEKKKRLQETDNLKGPQTNSFAHKLTCSELPHGAEVIKVS